MSLTRRAVLCGSAAALATPAILRAQPVPIRIGEINSYTAIPSFTLPYRNGWQLAVAQVNAAGGVLGRPLEVISRDDAGRPQDAVRIAGELLNEQKVDLLAGGYLSNVGLALSDVAAQNRVLYVAGEPLTDALVWERGHRYCFRLRPSTYMQAAMLVEEAAKLPARRWVAVAPNYEYGTSTVKWFRQLLQAKRPDVSFVAEQYPALGRIDAGATVAALEAARPEAILNVTFGPDLTNFVRQGNTRGLFESRSVVSVLTGEPEYLDPLGEETPEGWIVTGYPVDSVADPANRAFIAAYQAKFNVPPKMGSVVGHALIGAIVAGIVRAGGTGTEQLCDALPGTGFDTPFGRASWRAIDHQSTLGTYVGRTAVKAGRGTMVDWRYVDGAAALPADEVVRKLRPA
ncbi:ABC transporter substrate-binding protein [Rhodovastum atsumiense]|uniref:ABC transporter substrate-binding protein n=1 Tax=Rhodovastum atsumiense TaxID=504468 RepID=A0A5M6IPM6_9PROT|nr:ABC transporter substrate-binding protein [Rhodovastum atsumiense]KAA5610233.1 ABC transporter substrate-binding protein [Rhodovastum atsumiense]CAH2604147.1 ABC transporter substrate-binding protein [Rhodovastum atsumiense]